MIQKIFFSLLLILASVSQAQMCITLFSMDPVLLSLRSHTMAAIMPDGEKDYNVIVKLLEIIDLMDHKHFSLALEKTADPELSHTPAIYRVIVFHLKSHAQEALGDSQGALVSLEKALMITPGNIQMQQRREQLVETQQDLDQDFESDQGIW